MYRHQQFKIQSTALNYLTRNRIVRTRIVIDNWLITKGGRIYCTAGLHFDWAESTKQANALFICTL